MAAPIGSQVLGEVLPYLEATQDNQDTAEAKQEVVVPNITGMSISEAEKTLKNIGLEIKVETEEEIDKNEVVVKEQLPKHGIKVYEESKISVVI